MNNDNVIKAYSKIADQYAEVFYDELSSKQIDRKLYEMFTEKLSSSAKCAEIGCGPGEISIFLSNYITDITGIDKSEKMIEVAKRLNNKASCKNTIFNSNFCMKLPSLRLYRI